MGMYVSGLYGSDEDLCLPAVSMLDFQPVAIAVSQATHQSKSTDKPTIQHVHTYIYTLTKKTSKNTITLQIFLKTTLLIFSHSCNVLEQHKATDLRNSELNSSTPQGLVVML